jgi:predicted acyl esterase
MTTTSGPIAYTRVTARPAGSAANEHMVPMRDGVHLASPKCPPSPAQRS